VFLGDETLQDRIRVQLRLVKILGISDSDVETERVGTGDLPEGIQGDRGPENKVFGSVMIRQIDVVVIFYIQGASQILQPKR